MKNDRFIIFLSLWSILERAYGITSVRARRFHQGGIDPGKKRGRCREPDRDWLPADTRGCTLWKSVDDTVSVEAQCRDRCSN